MLPANVVVVDVEVHVLDVEHGRWCDLLVCHDCGGRTHRYLDR
jgi:hypothetical protein